MGEQTHRPPPLAQPDQEGNYLSRPLLALLRVWHDYLEEKVPEETVFSVLQAVAQMTQAQLDSIESQIESGQTNPESPIVQQVIESFEIHFDALELMAEHFEDPEQGLFEKGLEVIQEATNSLMEAHEGILDHIEETSQVNCMFCGQKNPRSGQKCSQCGRPIQAPGTEKSSLSVVQSEGLEKKQSLGRTTENCARLHHAVVGWRGGHLDADGLMSEMLLIEGNLRGHLEGNQRLRQKPGADTIAQALDVMDQGLHLSLAALAKMKMAFEKEDDSYLVNGLADFDAATTTVSQALDLLEAARSSD